MVSMAPGAAVDAFIAFQTAQLRQKLQFARRQDQHRPQRVPSVPSEPLSARLAGELVGGPRKLASNPPTRADRLDTSLEALKTNRQINHAIFNQLQEQRIDRDTIAERKELIQQYAEAQQQQYAEAQQMEGIEQQALDQRLLLVRQVSDQEAEDREADIRHEIDLRAADQRHAAGEFEPPPPPGSIIDVSA